jgi:hypothetical protein
VLLDVQLSAGTSLEHSKNDVVEQKKQYTSMNSRASECVTLQRLGTKPRRQPFRVSKYLQKQAKLDG